MRADMTILRGNLLLLTRLLGLAVMLVVAALGGALVALNTRAGQHQIEMLTAQATGGSVQISNLSGTFPAAPRIGRLAIADPTGVWLEVDNLALDWSVWSLLDGTALIHRLSADKVALLRWPAGPASQSSSGGPPALPVMIRLERLHVGRLDLGAEVAGVAAALSVEGAATADSLADGSASLALTRLDADGHYQLSGQVSAGRAQAHIEVSEPTHGLLASLAQLPDLGAIHLEGDFTLPPGARLPLGQITAQITGSDEPNHTAGLALRGAIDATAQISAEGGHIIATAKLRGQHVGIAGIATLQAASLDARIVDLDSTPQIDAQLQLDGIAAQGIGGSVVLTAQGAQNALDLGLRANLTGIGNGPVALRSTAKLDTVHSTLALSAFTANSEGEALQLLAPARLDFAGGMAVDQLRLGLRDATLAVSGRLSPTLDVTARLSNVTADLARIAAPDLRAAGMLQADAKLTGTLARPVGHVQITANGLRATTGPAASFPAADLMATADLAGSSAQINARFAAGENRATLSGTAPLNATGTMRLHAAGQLNLATLDRILAAGGRRLHGRAVLDVAIDGTPQAPRSTGALRLTDGEVQDFNLGLRISAIDALIEAQGDTIRISHFTGRAGPGTVSANGQISLNAPQPVDIGLTMNKARLLTSDQLTAALSSDLHLRGDLAGQLALGGSIRIDSGEIRVPESLPADVAVLNVRVRGAPPPPAPVPGPDIALALKIDAPGRIFVRGRGLDAELSGHLRIDGTAAAPQPVGTFEMRRGTFNLAGQTLNFTTGEVGFDGSGKIDPTLNFISSSTNGTVTATLTITGYASAPKIKLSAVPELPQDEVLAQLLFHTSSSKLTPLQLAQIAAGLAQVSGAGGGFDPLNSIRSALGLDTLSIGGGQNGSGPSVQAGHYVAPGVYVGAKQNASGSGTQATVQIDLMKGLKLETNVATSSATQANSTGAAASDSGTSVGLTYQFEY